MLKEYPASYKSRNCSYTWSGTRLRLA